MAEAQQNPNNGIAGQVDQAPIPDGGDQAALLQDIVNLRDTLNDQINQNMGQLNNLPIDLYNQNGETIQLTGTNPITFTCNPAGRIITLNFNIGRYGNNPILRINFNFFGGGNFVRNIGSYSIASREIQQEEFFRKSIIRTYTDATLQNISYFLKQYEPDEYIAPYWIKHNDPNFQNSFFAVDPPEINNINGSEWVRYILSVATFRIVTELKKNSVAAQTGWKAFDDYIPQRPVDLITSDVHNDLQNQNFYVPWEVVESACSSLNAGKHLIITGPPGCGKTQFAKRLAAQASIQPIMATASPNWSTNELIGRYLPNLGESNRGELRFHEGYFLEAKDDWLIIDEMNRCNIDACFGELFTVLAGESSVLPFEVAERSEEAEEREEDIDSERSISKESIRIKKLVISPYKPTTQQAFSEDRFKVYRMGPKFRMIGTMNDTDASRLHQLSFAFQRRFHIIKMETPDAQTIQAFITQKLTESINKINNDPARAIFPNMNQNLQAISRPILNYIFTHLIMEKVIGMSHVIDVIDFLLEGVSKPENHPGELVLGIGQAVNNNRILVIRSYIALGINLSVFPQLLPLATDHQKLQNVCANIYQKFGDGNLTTIKKNNNNNDGYETNTRQPGITIKNYLKSELQRAFQNTGVPNEVFG